jgi:HD-GYP domain-containing protein (c-di-GMP phosphodiesterase class II)
MKESDKMVTFEEIYSQAVKVSRNLIEDIRFSRSIQLELVQACAEQICNYLKTNTNILALLTSIQDKNPYMYSHPVNVGLISYFIGKWMNLSGAELPRLVLAAMLHDIGKAKVRDSILNKPEKLTEDEMKAVRSHTVIGYRILVSLDITDKDILSGVLSHHERQDGSGYPNGLKENQINIFGRIIAIADMYDAITSTKAYRMKSSPFKAAEEIQAGAFGSLDPKICQVFMTNIAVCYYGSHVRLSNELEGEIIYVNPEEKTKPLIRCEDKYLNLSKERDLEIVAIL